MAAWNATSARCVRVVDVDPMLVRDVPATLAARLRRQLVVDTVDIPIRGLVPVTVLGSGVLGYLILDGLLLRAVAVAGRRTVELLGPGDVVRPWQDEGTFAALPAASAWTALEPTRLAVLDADFAAAAYRFPAIADELLRRLVERCHALSVRLAIASIPSLPERLLAALWHLADRWGVVEPDGVRVPLRLSHQVLAELVCAQRPSVSVALKQLADGGKAMRAPGGGWVLLGAMPTLESGLSPAPLPAIAVL